MGYTTEQIGDMAERIVGIALSRPVEGRFKRPLFRAIFLGAKHPTVDLLVEALSARGEVRGFFFAQVKGTAQSVSGTRLPIGLSPDAFNRLVGYPAPTYLVVADVRMGQSYVVAAHRRRTRWLSSVGRELPLHSDATRIALYREVVGFWTGRRNPRRARFGNA